MKFSEWLKIRSKRENKPSVPRDMTKVPHKEKKSGGSRCCDDDLSSDFKGHVAHNGEVKPFKLIKKTGKTVTDIAR